MKIQVADKNIIITYKKDIIEYIKDVLNENDCKSSEEEVNNIYNNMCDFIEDKTAIILVAIKNNELLGFIWAYKKIVNKENRLHINYFVVNSYYRGNGIGKKLIDKLYEVAKKEKINILELMVTANNKKACSFYEKQEFFIERVKLCKKI